MDLKGLGATNLRISPIGLGLAALGRPGYINIGHGEDLNKDYNVQKMEARAFSVLDAAYGAGVRYFDAARSYGRAEEFLGNWLNKRGFQSKTVVVGSKWGYTYTADWKIHAEAHEIKDHSLPVLERQWRESQFNLGQHLDLYQIHSATIDSGVLENSSILNELGRLKSEGVKIGLSVSGPLQRKIIESAIALKIDGTRLFDCVQATWNLLEKSAGRALSKAREKGMGIIVKEALANGRLTGRNKDFAFSGNLKILKEESHRLNTTVDGLSIAAVLAQPWADVVLSGAATSEHLRSNLKALHVKFDSEAVSKLDRFDEGPDIYWQKRSALKWN